MMTHQEEGLIFRAIFQEIDRQVGDDISGVPPDHLSRSHFDEIGVVIFSLSRQDIPIIEPGGVARQMPFANHPGMVTGLLQHLGYGGLAAIEPVENRHPVDMTVFSRENRGPARRANRVDGKAVQQAHALVCNPI
jgi:hypothetical protein